MPSVRCVKPWPFKNSVWFRDVLLILPPVLSSTSDCQIPHPALSVLSILRSPRRSMVPAQMSLVFVLRGRHPKQIFYSVVDMAEDSSGDCLVCFNPCTTFSNELFLYNCNCVYRVHADCFKEWRRVADSDRICVICQETLHTFEEEEVVVQPVNPGLDHRIDRTITQCIKNIVAVSLYTLLIAYLSVWLYALQHSWNAAA